MALEVDGTDIGLIHEEDDLATGAIEGGPVACENSLLEGVVCTAHVVRGDDLGRREDRTNFSVERIEGRRAKGFGFGKFELFDRTLFGFDEDEDGDVIGVGMRPLLYLFEAGCKRLAVAAVVDVLDMHHLEAGPVHDAVGIEGRIGWKAC